MATSHGLVVLNTPFDFDRCTLRIMNPGTSEYIDLPLHVVKGVKLTFDAISAGDVPYECDILTVGSYDGSWRHLRTDRLSREAKSLMSMGPGLSTEGFVHWVPSFGGEKVLVSGGKNLTLVVALGILSWDVWEMNPEMGVWRKAFSVGLEKEMWRFEEVFLNEDDRLIPVWLVKLPGGDGVCSE
ncbi:Unknown protein [Striga hermonthica]|uniref:Uncharacterized protein n=1 Tax=Striga hermonthica TaxID=68872 RepID=A0A9N7N2J4_STRHE|nr:Unknown protein [Striga hermonthica]